MINPRYATLRTLGSHLRSTEVSYFYFFYRPLIGPNLLTYLIENKIEH